jgi:hypothetical protein
MRQQCLDGKGCCIDFVADIENKKTISWDRFMCIEERIDLKLINVRVLFIVYIVHQYFVSTLFFVPASKYYVMNTPGAITC